MKNNIFKTSLFTLLCGCTGINSINNDILILKDVKRICRNSFWNCKGIKKLVLPKSLEQIGYNPFVGCSNIEFISNTNKFIVYNGAHSSEGRCLTNIFK